MNIFEWLLGSKEDETERVDLSRRNLFGQAAGAAIAAPLLVKAATSEAAPSPPVSVPPAAAREEIHYLPRCFSHLEVTASSEMFYSSCSYASRWNDRKVP